MLCTCGSASGRTESQRHAFFWDSFHVPAGFATVDAPETPVGAQLQTVVVTVGVTVT